MSFEHPTRTAWGEFPNVLLHEEESLVKKHPRYREAKSGDANAALDLVAATVNATVLDDLKQALSGRLVFVTPIHAQEAMGINQIPSALAGYIADVVRAPMWKRIVQINQVGHTSASGYHRMANQPLFTGEVMPGADYLLVDDFVGQGGTLANLRGYIEQHGGRVILATALTGKWYSAILKPSLETLSELRSTHGPELERWWQAAFGHGFDLLTQSEARYLARSPDADTIGNSLLASRLGALRDALPTTP